MTSEAHDWLSHLAGDERPPEDPPRLTVPLRKRKKQATRRRILDAARDSFLANGFVGSSIEAIVDAAEVSRPTFYQYFKNKTDALSALVLEQRPSVLSHIDTLGPAPSLQQLRAWIDGLLEQFEMHHATMSAWTQAESTEPEFQKVADAIMNSLIDAYTDHFVGSADGPAAGVEIRTRVMLLVLQLERYTYFECVRGWEADREAVVSALADIWLAALVAPSGARAPGA